MCIIIPIAKKVTYLRREGASARFLNYWVGWCLGKRDAAGLTYKIPLPVGDVVADVASLLVVQLQVDLGRETHSYKESKNMK